jgi:hypothetical protein
MEKDVRHRCPPSTAQPDRGGRALEKKAENPEGYLRLNPIQKRSPQPRYSVAEVTLAQV